MARKRIARSGLASNLFWCADSDAPHPPPNLHQAETARRLAATKRSMRAEVAERRRTRTRPLEAVPRPAP